VRQQSRSFSRSNQWLKRSPNCNTNQKTLTIHRFFGKETLFMSSKSLPDFIDGLVFGLMWVPAPSVMPCERVGNSKMSAC